MSNEKKTTTSSGLHWHDVLHKEFEGESDRACVILAASLLDTALISLLQARLCPNPGNSDPLFDGANAPLSTFSARIDMCFRLGILSSRFCRDLHLIRKIRNDFAHNVAGCAFTESAIRDRIQALAHSSRFSQTDESWRNMFPDTPKGQFLFCVSWMQWELHDRREKAEPITLAQEEFGYSLEWKPLSVTSTA